MNTPLAQEFGHSVILDLWHDIEFGEERLTLVSDVL
jgi:hypothetical protein